MLSKEDLVLTMKYMNDYSLYCSERECGEGCPVFDLHQKDPTKSCFRIYCELREAGDLPAPNIDPLHAPYKEIKSCNSN